MSASYQWSGDRLMAKFRGAVVAGLTAVQVEFQKQIGRKLNTHASNRTRGGIPSPVGGPPGKATGTLARSWQATPVIERSGLNDPLRPRLSIGSNLVYARIHEFGGTISGKPWLKIPVSAEAKRAEARGASLIGLAFVKSRKGNLLLVERPKRAKKLGRQKSKLARRYAKRFGVKPGRAFRLTRQVNAQQNFGKVHYVLKRSVTMPKRPYVLPSLEATRPLAAGIVRGFTDRVLAA